MRSPLGLRQIVELYEASQVVDWSAAQQASRITGVDDVDDLHLSRRSPECSAASSGGRIPNIDII